VLFSLRSGVGGQLGGMASLGVDYVMGSTFDFHNAGANKSNARDILT